MPYDSILKDVMHGYAQKNRSIVGAGMPGSDFNFWHYDDRPEEGGRPTRGRRL